MMKYIDVHAHVNFAAFDHDREETVKRTLEGDTWMINVGTQKDTAKGAVELANRYEKGVYAIVGLHPIHTDKSYHDEKELGEGARNFTSRGEVFDYEYYKKLAMDPKVVGIGECGLDYYKRNTNQRMETNATNERNTNLRLRRFGRSPDRSVGDDTNKDEDKDTSIERQKEAFRKQIELANLVNKPLMLHVRNPSEEISNIQALPRQSSGQAISKQIPISNISLDKARDKQFPMEEGGNPPVRKNGPPPLGKEEEPRRVVSAYRDAVAILKAEAKVKANFHFFAGTIEEFKEILDAGFYVSFTGVITFAKEYEELIQYAPMDRIMSETDCPYVTPAPYRGKRNEPLYVKEVVKKIAEIKKLSLEKTAEELFENARGFFDI
ncbi:MAG: hypothetical protein A3B98_00075 [Candidatus Taylorbacteria bacterium RIFCSPHIGHO2_02_FULL_43_55]|nr:MAG: hypothetical protein A3B98_00075 [Candidatus Taylorbacteria bacterium RIFCSPHIGHO2_02_FULL_43_55]